MSQAKPKPKTQPVYLDRGHHCIILENTGSNPFGIKIALRKYKGIDDTRIDDILKNVPVVLFKNIAQHEADDIRANLEYIGATIQQVDHDELAQLIVKDIRRQTEMDALQTELTALRRKLIQAQNGNGVGMERQSALPPALADTFRSQVYDILNPSERVLYDAKRSECHAKGWKIAVDQSLGTVVQNDSVKAYIRLTWIETQPAAIQPVPETAQPAISVISTPSDEQGTEVIQPAAQSKPFIVSVTDLTIQPGPTRIIKPTAVDIDGETSDDTAQPQAANAFQMYREDLARQREQNMIPFQQAVERARNFTPSTIPGRGESA